MKSLILVVDDQLPNRQILQRTLRGTYRLVFAADGKEALDKVYEKLPDLILLDIMMPVMDGHEVCRTLKADKETSDVPIIFVTAKVDASDETKGLSLGAVDYISKPINPSIVLARVKAQLLAHAREMQLSDMVNKRTAELKDSEAHLERSHIEALLALMEASKLKDNETANHTLRMAMICYLIALEIGYAREDAYMLFLAAPLHDIGKLGVRDNVLFYPGNLRIEKPELWILMEKHTTYGANILGKYDLGSAMMQMAYQVALCHHEKKDGSGYPRGLKGDNIPEVATIAAVADMIDAMLDKDRPYRNGAISEERVKYIICEEKGVKLPENVVDAALGIWPDIIRIEEIFADRNSFPFATFAGIGADNFFDSTQRLIRSGSIPLK